MRNDITKYGTFLRESLRLIGFFPKMVVVSEDNVSFGIIELGRFTFEQWYMDYMVADDCFGEFSVFMAGRIDERKKLIEGHEDIHGMMVIPIDERTRELVVELTRARNIEVRQFHPQPRQYRKHDGIFEKKGLNSF